MRGRIVLFLLVGVLAAVLGFVSFSAVTSVELVRDYGFWFVAAAFAGTLFHLCRDLWRDGQAPEGAVRGRGWWMRAGPGVLVVLLGATYLQTQDEHGFKIVADEYLLSSTAKHLHEHRQGALILRAYDFSGNFVTLNSRVDKRPLTFPFLIALLHDTTGYRFENVFVLNALLSAALTGLFFVIGRRIGGVSAGTVAVAWICIVPLVVQNATGAGFELLNMVMILLVIWLGMRYAEQPANDDRMAALLYATVLLAQVRYESALFVVPTGVMVAYGWWRQRAVRLPLAAFATPLLLLPVPWLQNVFKLSEASWQLKDVEGATSPFGLQYFYDNIGHALNFFFTTDGSQPSAWLLALLGILATGFFGLLLYKEKGALWQNRPADAALVIGLIGLILHTALMLCYFWGKWDDPIIRRLSLPAHVLLLLVLLWVWGQVPGLRRRWWVLLAMAGFQWAGWSAPTIARAEYNAENFAARTTNWLQDFAREKTAAGRRILAIDPAADLMWFLHDQSALNPFTLAKRTKEFDFHYQQGTFDEVYLVQRVIADLTTGVRFVSAEQDYGEAFGLEQVAERAFAPTYIIRISRVTTVNLDALNAWAEKFDKIQETETHADGGAAAGVSEVQLDVDALNNWITNLP